MMTVNLAVGQVTPPVAVNLYVGAQIADLTDGRNDAAGHSALNCNAGCLSRHRVIPEPKHIPANTLGSLESPLGRKA